MDERKMTAGPELPEVFLARMQELLGEETEAFLQSYETERVQGLRLNTGKTDRDQTLALCMERFGLKRIPWCRDGYYYKAETRPGRHPYHEAGMYYIQEPSAMAATELLDPQPGDRVLDLCAAPGGKATQAAVRLGGRGVLVCNEIMPNRAKILSQNMERMGAVNAVVTNEEAAKLNAFFPEYFDKMIVDAPCSGEGMFRKDENAREEWSEDNVKKCAARQQEILDHAAGMLRSGGRMVYSTCTFAPEEDEGGIAEFLLRHPEFHVVPCKDADMLPGLCRGNASWAAFGSGRTYPDRITAQISHTFRIWPHKAEGEGHFLALLEKNGEMSAAETGQKKKNVQKGFCRDKAVLKTVKQCMDRILAGQGAHCPASSAPILIDYDRLILFGDQLYMVPEGLPSLDGLRVLRPGLHLGTVLKNRMEPAHALALALRTSQAAQNADFPAQGPEIMAYLSGDTVPVDPAFKGWTLVSVDGCSLGWGKAVGGILKNHYPKGLRIFT